MRDRCYSRSNKRWLSRFLTCRRWWIFL